MSRTHRPLLWVTITFIMGIWGISFAATGTPDTGCWPWLITIACVVIGGILACRGVLGILILYAGLGALSLLTVRTLPADHIARAAVFLKGSPVTFTGLIVSDVDISAWGKNDLTRGTVALEEACRNKACMKVSGNVLVSAFGVRDVAYGDRIRFQGKLGLPEEWSTSKRLSNRERLKRKSIYYAVTVKKTAEVLRLARGRGNYFCACFINARTWGANVFRKYCSSGEAGLVNPLLLGDRSNLSPHVRDLFKRTGTSHILAVSGFNVGMIVSGLGMLLTMFPIPRPLKYSCVILGGILYAGLTGNDPPVARSAIMSAIILGSFLLEREGESLNTVAIAVFGIL
ncbi:MAG: ComEC/Rec2 family competence protein, partial [Candidatus Omnitrophica bacterium]|nr:ComEC/Rec2 family competence protein [Candidatus Omnitrophota bacterium]